MADTDVLERDLGIEIREPIKEPEKQKEHLVPDDTAAWAISLDYEFTEGIVKDMRTRTKKGFDYYNGQQWDPALRKEMTAANRPVLTFNEIRPKIDALIGEERRNREDWVAKPREGSDEAQADVRTALLKYVRDINALQADESRVFEEGTIGGFGGMIADLVQDPDGGPPLLRIEYRPWRELRWDWTSRKRDFTDAQWMALSVMADPDKLAELLPNWANQITGEYANLVNDPLTEEVDIGERVGVSRYRDGMMRRTLYNATEKKIRALQFYHRTVRTRRILDVVTPNGPRQFEVPDGNPQILQRAAALIQSGQARPRIVREQAIRGSLIVGRQTLAQWWSPFNGKNAFGQPYFPIFIWFASDTDGYIMGLVEAMISPQDEVNKRWTMTVENYLRQARSGGTYEEGAFVNETEVKSKWGSPGYWAKVKQGAHTQQSFKEHTAKPTDQALMTLFQMAEQAMERVSNIDRARIGLQSREESGAAIRTRALQSALVQVKAFDNFRHMQWLLGQFLNANLHLMFPVERTMRLTMPNGDNQEVTINQAVRLQSGAVAVANDMRAGTMFDIIMDMTPSNATFREMQAQNLANLIGQIGPPMKELPWFLPAYAELLKGLIRMLDGLPNRQEIVKMLDQSTQQFLNSGGVAPGMGTAGPPMPGAAPPGAPPGQPAGLPFNPAAFVPTRPGQPTGVGTFMQGGR